jgi:hypothetical protein
MDLENANQLTRQKWANSELNWAKERVPLDDNQKLASFNRLYPEVHGLKYIEEHSLPYQHK